MSRIDDLIRDLCPDGVKFRTLEEIFETRNGYTPSKNDAEAWAGNDIPWFRMDDIRSHGRILRDATQRISKSAVKGGRTFPANSILVATSATIGEHALVRVPHLSNQRFTNLALKDNFKGSFDAKFLFYCCFKLDEWCLKNTTTSSFSSVDMKGFKNFKFPIPPLEVQNEITRTLDQFTQLEAELEAELEARRQQYSFYRRRLLNFSTASNIRWQPLGEIAEIRSGWGFPKSEQGRNVGEIPFYKVSDMNLQGNEVTLHSASNYIDAATAERLRIKPAPAGTIVFPKIGAALRTNKKRILSQMSAYDNNVMGLIPTPQISPYFLYHWMQEVNLAAVANDSGAVPSIRKSVMATIPFPLLPSNEQRHIVSILDNFDAVINDLGSGLPAEIEARRKQYEYYRDRLLTFPEKN